MKRLVALISLLLAGLYLFASEHNARAAVQLQLTGTTTTGTGTLQPTGTQGTPAPTGTPTETPEPTSTTTLVPLPPITLIFPAASATPTVTITPEFLPFTETAYPADGATLTNLSPRLRVLVIFVIVLWVLLLGFAIVYIRQFR